MGEKPLDIKQLGIEGRVFNDEDLENEEVFFDILERGVPEEVERFRAFHNLKQERVEIMKYYAQLRRATLDQMYLEIDRRIANSPRATAEENAMGAYQESIEPQVRDALTALRRKGYATTSSGFAGLDSQHILFARSYQIKISEALQRDLKIKGVLLSGGAVRKQNKIAFECGQLLTITELKQVWNKIVEAMPDLGSPAAPSLTGVAESFRRRQVKLAT